jgi:Outer membrane protein (porin)
MAEIYNKDGNKLDLYGKVDGLHYFSDDKGADGDQTYMRLGFKGETQINNMMTGYAQWEYNIQANNTEGSDNQSWTRLAFAGVKVGDYGSFDYGRNYGVLYDVEGWTDMLPEFGGDSYTKADNFMFYGGKMKGMPPKLMSDDGKHIVIRPLAYCREKDIERFSQAKAFPIIPCNLCGSQPNLQRQVIGDMLRDWDKRYPGRIETMFSAMQNVVPSHLADVELFDFKGINHGSEVVNGGDLAFDREELPMQPAGWQPEEDDTQFEELRLNVLEVK